MTSTSLSLDQQPGKHLTWLVIGALVGIAYFVLAIVIMHFLRSADDPVRLTTSVYAVGPYGYLMTSAFFSVSLASLALTIGLYKGIAPTARSRTGFGLLGIWVFGVLVAMIFPIDLDGASRTTAGTIHRVIGPVAFLSLGAGAILVSGRLKYDDSWRSMRQVALPLAVFMLAAFVVTGLNIALDSGFQGLFQRIVLVTFVAWFILMATRLGSIAREIGPNGTG